MGAGKALLDKAGIPATLLSEGADPGLLQFGGDDAKAAIPAFIEALAKHRHFARETDPPRI
jgi:catalase